MQSVMEGRVKMREVKVEKAVLLTKIKANREKHAADYKDACEDYRKLCLAELAEAEKCLADRKARCAEAGMKPIDMHGISFDVIKPQDHTKDYDAVISMLEMSIDNEIMLRSDEHACYVMDDWSWKRDFENIYASNKVRSMSLS